jgi:hypothetical protein
LQIEFLRLVFSKLYLYIELFLDGAEKLYLEMEFSKMSGVGVVGGW